MSDDAGRRPRGPGATRGPGDAREPATLGEAALEAITRASPPARVAGGPGRPSAGERAGAQPRSRFTGGCAGRRGVPGSRRAVDGHPAEGRHPLRRPCLARPSGLPAAGPGVPDHGADHHRGGGVLRRRLAHRGAGPFAAGVLTSALAPTNTLPGNPAALKHAFDTAGRAWPRGPQPARRRADQPRHAPAGGHPAVPGRRELGATPGKVVFRNEVVESSSTPRSRPRCTRCPAGGVVADQPFLHPRPRPGPQLPGVRGRPGNPGLRHELAQPRPWAGALGPGHLRGALLEAMDAVGEISGSDRIGTIGLCSGGQLLAATLALLARGATTGSRTPASG